MDLIQRAKETMAQHDLATAQTPALLMVSGGSDSTALAYVAAELRDRGELGPLAMLHMNHQLRGEASDQDAAFVEQLAAVLEIPLFMAQANIAGMAEQEKGNVEAIARRERYASAADALKSLCGHFGAPLEEGRILVAHTQDDRVENFFMRSIVGTGPGGFRSMTYRTGVVCRPLLDASRQDLRDYIEGRLQRGLPVLADGSGAFWREDESNQCTDYFRNFVRKEIVPKAKERNPQLLTTLCRTMNLIADEDDYLEQRAEELRGSQFVEWVSWVPFREPEYDAGCTLLPAFGKEPMVLKRRAVQGILQDMLGFDARIETASVEAVLAGFGQDGAPVSGYVTNIQGDLAVSANKNGVLVEPMSSFRARRKRQ